MKRLSVLCLLLIFNFAACKKKEETNIPSNLPAGTHAVKVIEHKDVTSYTYLKVSENGNEYWIAAPQTKVEDGEVVFYSQGMEMKNFHSETLNKTFPTIYFVQSISQSPQTPSLSSVHQQAATSPKEQISIEPAKGGKTIAEIYSQKDKLAGKTVTVRGKVVKYNAGIMGRNWIHIQDGTGSGENYDILITSNDETALGKIITAEGKVVLNKDFGAGYSYSVMLEGAKIKSE